MRGRPSIVILLLAACTPSPPAAPSTMEPTDTPAATASRAPTTTTEPSATATAEPAALAAMLPIELAGVELHTFAVGEEILAPR